MQTISARELLGWNREELNRNLPESITLAFEDGVNLVANKKSVIYSDFFWDILRSYPMVSFSSRYLVDSILKGRPLNSNTHMSLLEVIYADVIRVYDLHLPEQKEHIMRMIYEVTNNIHNEVAKLAEPYVGSIDILDFINVIEHPTIKQLVDNTEPNHESISNTYEGVLDVIKNDTSFKSNNLIAAMRSGMVNANQVLQCVTVRGFLTEVDGSILPEPIMSNYTKGMNTLHDFAAESCSARKALYFSEAPLQDAEYFARRLQLLDMTIENITYTDCGTTKYMEWRVMPPKLDENGNKVYPGDLEFMTGKFYLDETTNTLKEITFNDPELHNKLIKIRTVLYCQTEDPHSVCEVCFGGLSRNKSRFANLGHLCSATMTQQTSQSVLSTKHLDASSVSANIILTELSQKYLATNKAKNAYLVKKELKHLKPRIIVNRDEAIGLVDILSIDDVDNINPIRISSIEFIELVLDDKKQEQSIPLNVNQGNRRAIMTSEFLKYLKEQRWETDNKNNFVFDLSKWNFDLPILKLPDMEYSFSDHSHQIARVIESNMKSITERAMPHSPISTLQELFGLVNTKLNVNIANLEIIIYSTMLPSKDDYRLARNVDQPVLGIVDLVIKNRSLSAAYGYEHQIQSLTNPRSFFKLDRPDSLLDVFIAPFEVVSHYKQK